MAGATEYDAIVLDVLLPGIDGFETCKRLRRDGVWAPVLMVTARDGIEDRVAGLDGGADDYLTKPFSMPELLARLRVAFRHRHTVATVGDGDILQVGALMIDTGARAVIVAEKPIDLRHKEYELLVLLARNVGKVMTHQAISSRLWGRSAPPGRGGSLRWHVMQLRKKLAEGHQSPDLLTEPGVGYRLALPEVDRRPSAAGRQRRRVATAAPLL
jgi:two-component system OmpR family response regulator